MITRYFYSNNSSTQDAAKWQRGQGNHHCLPRVKCLSRRTYI